MNGMTVKNMVYGLRRNVFVMEQANILSNFTKAVRTQFWLDPHQYMDTLE